MDVGVSGQYSCRVKEGDEDGITHGSNKLESGWMKEVSHVFWCWCRSTRGRPGCGV